MERGELARPIRIVLVESADSGHDLEAECVSGALRDAGLEIIYAGRAKTAPEIVQVAIQEDAATVGLTGDAHELAPEVVRLLREEGADHITVRVIRPGESAADILETHHR